MRSIELALRAVQLWLNDWLGRHGKRCHDVTVDLKDGKLLYELLEAEEHEDVKSSGDSLSSLGPLRPGRSNRDANLELIITYLEMQGIDCNMLHSRVSSITGSAASDGGDSDSDGSLDDDGSAAVLLLVWKVFEHLRGRSALFGVPMPVNPTAFAKELLAWAQAQAQANHKANRIAFPDRVPNNLTGSWADGEVLWYLVQSSGVQLNSLSEEGLEYSGIAIAQRAIDVAHEKMQVPKILTPRELPDEWCSNDLAMALYLAELRWGINRRKRRLQGKALQLEPRAPVIPARTPKALAATSATAAESNCEPPGEQDENAVEHLRKDNEALEEKHIIDSAHIKELQGRIVELENESRDLAAAANLELEMEKQRADDAEKELYLERDRANEAEGQAEQLREEIESMSMDLSKTQERLEELREKIEEQSSPGAQVVLGKTSAGEQDDSDDVAILIEDGAKAAAAAAAAWNVSIVYTH
jgi:hypothetical protein